MSDLPSVPSSDRPEALAAPSAPAAPAASRWEDFIDIVYAPTSVFARRATSGFGIPMLVVTLLVGVIFLSNSGALQPVMDAEFHRAAEAQMRNNPQLTPEMMEKGRKIGETIGKVGIFVIVPVTILLVGLTLWLCGKLVESKQTFAAAIMVASYAYIPRVLEAVLNGVQGLLLDPSSLNGRYRLSLGVGRFLDPDVTSPPLLAIVGRIDLFTIWITVLLAIGLSVTGKIPRSRSALAAVLVWVVGMLPGLLGALRNG